MEEVHKNLTDVKKKWNETNPVKSKWNIIEITLI